MRCYCTLWLIHSAVIEGSNQKRPELARSDLSARFWEPQGALLLLMPVHHYVLVLTIHLANVGQHAIRIRGNLGLLTSSYLT